jgi:hypothetical protein
VRLPELKIENSTHPPVRIADYGLKIADGAHPPHGLIADYGLKIADFLAHRPSCRLRVTG